MLVVSLLYAGAAVVTGIELIRYVRADDAVEAGEPSVVDSPSETEDDDGEETDSFEAIDESFGVSVGALALSLMGNVVPFARLVSVPLLIVGIVPSAREAWHNVRETKKIDYVGLTTVGTFLEISLGYTSLAAFGWIVFTGGQHLQLLTRRKIERKIDDAVENMNERVWVYRDEVEVEVPIKDLSLDDVVILRAGDPVPVDGVIIEGAIAVDQRALTGESRPVERVVGEEVYAATLVLSGTARVQPDRTGADTLAGRTANLMARAESFEQGLRDRAEREAELTVRPTMLLMGLGALGGGPVSALAGFWSNASELSWFGLPYSVMNTVEEAARSTILIKDGRSLDELCHVDTVVFDKTGTLTLDTYVVDRVHPCADYDERELLGFAASLEQRQDHPVARAIISAAKRNGVQIDAPRDLETAVGLGLRGRLHGLALVLGSARLMAAHEIDISVVEDLSWVVEARGHSAIYIAVEGQCVGMLELAPELRPEVFEVLERLRVRGLDLMMVSGDAQAPCAALAAELGIGSYYAETLPEDKARIISELQAHGRRVCFIGDGINDGLALKTANVSISMSGASTLAVDNAQILMQSGSLEQLDELFSLAKRFEREQRVIAGIARGVTFASGLGFLLLGLELPVIVWIYLAAAGSTLAVSSLPRLRSA